jgi:capsid protein
MSYLSRLRNRMAVALAGRGWEAAASGRRWEGSTGLAAPNSSMLAARGPARQRAGDAYVNNAHAHRAVELLVASLVGSGFQAQSQHPDPATRRQENDAFEDLVASILICLARSLIRDGEAVARIVARPDGRLSVLLLSAEQLDPTLHRELGGGARIVAGVEFDADGERAAYWLLPEAPDLPSFAGFRQAVRVPAADVFHAFDPLFPGQVRDAEGGTGGYTGTKDGSALDLSLEPGTLRVLPPGTDVTFSEPGKGLSDLPGFMTMQLRESAAGSAGASACCRRA